jgi:hypothetical protein
LAFKVRRALDIDEFVSGRMPVALARPIAWRPAHEIDTAVSEPAAVTQPLTNAFGDPDHV